MSINDKDSVVNIAFGIQLTAIAIFLVLRDPVLGYSAIVADLVILAGLWFALTGYVTDEGSRVRER